MIGVTIGIGKEWYKVARIAADRMEQCTGLPCFVIKDDGEPIDVVHPSWIKCKVLDLFPQHNEFLVFDADVVAKRRWNPSAIFHSMGRAFCAVPDNRNDDVFRECNTLGISFPDIYINAGLTIFGREHKPIWDAVWERHPGPFGKWLEQGALNIALLESACEVCRLPRCFNTLLHKAHMFGMRFDISRAVNVHFCSVNNPEALLELQSKVKINASDQQTEDTVGVAGDAAQVCCLR